MNFRATQEERPALEIGETFANYRIEELAGRQRGIGRVYVATHLESERQLEFPPWPIALKVFSLPPGQEEEFRARFEAAAKLQAGLNHPNVVSIYEVGTEPQPFMSMTLFRGPTLADLIAARHVDEPDMLPIIDSVAAALDGGIQCGLTYRRLRPGGVLVATDAQRAFLGDFGVGRAESINELLDNEELGTFVDYISPEEVRSSAVSASSNVYSLAAIAFECLTGEPPYPHQEGEQSLQARVNEKPRPLRALRPDLPASLESVLVRALDPEPRRRPASPGELAQAIRAAYPKRRRRSPRLRANITLARTPPLPASAPAAEPATDGAKPAPARERPAEGRRLLKPALLLVALLVAGAAVLGALVAPGPEPEPPPTPAEELAAGPANLRYPADWRRVEDHPAVPGLALTDPVVLSSGAAAADGSASRALVIGHAALEELRRPDSETVDLGGVQAYRYRDIRPEWLSGRMNLYVVPTSGDAIAIACLAPTTTDSFMDRCERTASTLRLTGETALPLAPSPAYASRIRGIIDKLDSARTSARRRLGGARTRNGQAGNAARVAVAYRVAARSAARLTPPPGAREAHREIASQLSRAERAYRGMATAARSGSAASWRSNRGAAVAAEAALQRALNDLQRLGYRPQSE